MFTAARRVPLAKAVVPIEPVSAVRGQLLMLPTAWRSSAYAYGRTSPRSQ